MKFMRVFVVSILILVLTASVWAQKARHAENFSAVSLAGQTVELASLRGKIVLLTFWSSRCPICQSEIPKLNQLAAGYANSDIVFLAATMENENIVKPFFKNNPFNFTILPNSFDLLLKYADRDRSGNLDMGFPAYYLIDRWGVIEYSASGWDKIKPLGSAINKLVSSR